MTLHELCKRVDAITDKHPKYEDALCDIMDVVMEEIEDGSDEEGVCNTANEKINNLFHLRKCDYATKLG